MKNVRDRLPIFELVDDGVKVEITNEGTGYIGSEEFIISYEDFNKYLEGGIGKRERDGAEWDILHKKIMGANGNRPIRIPAGTVRWSLAGDNLEIVELVGGRGFHTIDSIVTSENTGNKKKELEVDYGSIYEVTMTLDVAGSEECVKVTGVQRFEGILYYEGRSARELKRVPYLERYLQSVVKEVATYKNGDYTIESIESYLTDMKMYKHSESFLGEVQRVNGTKEMIDWGAVSD